MNYDQYHALPGVRSTDLKQIAKSPLHYREQVDNDTASRGMLRAIHCLLLEPENFAADFSVYPGKVRRGKQYDAWRLCNEGRTSLTEKDEAKARAVAAGVMRHPGASLLLSVAGESETTLEWIDPATRLQCKARLDRLTVSGLIVDLKCYGTSDPRQIARRVVQLGAHIQMAHYHAGLQAVRGIDARVVIVSFEDKSPFDVAVVEFEASGALAAGYAERARLMSILAECTARGHWPGRCPDMVPLDLPDWAMPGIGDGDDIDIDLDHTTPEINP